MIKGTLRYTTNYGPINVGAQVKDLGKDLDTTAWNLIEYYLPSVKVERITFTYETTDFTRQIEVYDTSS